MHPNLDSIHVRVLFNAQLVMFALTISAVIFTFRNQPQFQRHLHLQINPNLNNIRVDFRAHVFYHELAFAPKIPTFPCLILIA